jgi:hypothetical protein
MGESFEAMLTGGHPNSLGQTIEVVNLVLADPSKLADLYSCYFSTNETVRLRTSNGIKPISKEKSEWLIPYIDGLIAEIAKIPQASSQWTITELFLTLTDLMSVAQKIKARQILQRNLETWAD